MRHSLMRGYSVDLRKKTIHAVQHGSPKAEVARTYGAGLPTVERYMKMAEEEGSLNPKTASGRLLRFLASFVYL
jgi:transposase